MAKNCFGCKWHMVRCAGQPAMIRLGVTDCDIESHCEECVREFAAACSQKPATCISCPWKDRNLPYERRMRHCRVCAEEFAKRSKKNCAKCPWNDASRRMPTDATLAHCKACLDVEDVKTQNNCETCRWRSTPESVRKVMCLKCSLRFSGSSKVRWSTNELSNKGQTIVSYDNHNPTMTDDRDTVTKLDGKYVETMRSVSGPGSIHPVHDLASKAGMNGSEYAEFAYARMKRFLYELGQLSDMQALLFLAEVKGMKKTEFARVHNLTESSVDMMFKKIVCRSEIFKDFILLSRGSLEGTRGRKSKRGNPMERVPKKTMKIVYAGVFQGELGI